MRAVRLLFRRQGDGLPLSWHFLITFVWASAVGSLMILFSATPVVVW